MSNYSISPHLDKNKVFLLKKSELEKRWDPNTYHIERRDIIEALKNSGHKLEPLKFVATFNKTIVNKIPDNYPYVGLENIESNTGSYIPTTEKESISSAILFNKGQVLFPKLRPYLNKVFFANFDGVCSTEFHVLNGLKVSSEYLANFLRTSIVVNQTKYLMSGNTLPRLQTEDIESLLIPILSDEKETKANEIMLNVFNKKKLNESQAEKLLLSIDDYLLKELGISLPTPPENNLKNRIFKINLKEISGNRIDPRYYKNYYIKFYENIGNKYSTKRLYNICEYIGSGSTPKAGGEAYTNNTNGVPFIRITNIKNDTINIDDVLYIKREIHDTTLKRTQLNAGDLLLSMAGTIGLTVIVPSFLEEGNINQALARIVLKDEVNNVFIKEILNSKIGKIQTDRLSRPAVQANINFDEIGSLIIPIPPLAKQKEIANHITSIRQQAQKLKDKTKEAISQANKEIENILLN